MLRSGAARLARIVRKQCVRRFAWPLIAFLAAMLTVPPAQAHDLPDELLVRTFAKPDGDRLHVITRVPLALLEGMGLAKRGAGYLDLPHLGEGLERSAVAVARTFVFFEDGIRLTPDKAAWRISQPSEDAFGSFEQARAHVLGPALPDSANVFWNQGYYDVHLQYPIASAQSDFALETHARGLGGILKLFVDFLPPEGNARTYEIHGDHGWLDLDPSWHAAAVTFVKLGFDHVLQNIKYLLFLLCLVLPFHLRRLRSLLATVAALMIAQSVALLAAASGAAPAGDWFAPLIRLLLALSIVGLALDNIVYGWLNHGSGRQLSWRWLPAGALGLCYGFGFSFALGEELQFAGAHLVSSLVAFDIGILLGQIAVLAVAVPLLMLLLRSVPAQRAAIVIGSAFLAHTGWHWAIERADALRYVMWPELALPPATLALLLLVGAVAVALLWQAHALFQRTRRLRGAP